MYFKQTLLFEERNSIETLGGATIIEHSLLLPQEEVQGKESAYATKQRKAKIPQKA